MLKDNPMLKEHHLITEEEILLFIMKMLKLLLKIFMKVEKFLKELVNQDLLVLTKKKLLLEKKELWKEKLELLVKENQKEKDKPMLEENLK